MNTILTPQPKPESEHAATEKRCREWVSSAEYRAEVEASQEIARLLQRNACRKQLFTPPPSDSAGGLH